MGKLLGFLGGPFGTYALIALGVVVLGMAGTISWLWNARTDLLIENGALSATLETALSANESQSGAITALEQSARQIRELCTTSAARQDEAAKQAESLAQIIRRESATRAKLEAQDYENPDCTKLLQTDLSAVCPAIADSLRLKSAGR